MSDSESNSTGWSFESDEDDTWNGIPFDELTPAQWQTRAIEMFLERAGRSDLQAVPNSFRIIAHVERINLYFANLRVVPNCINLLTGLRELVLGSCKLNRDDSLPDTLWQLTGLEKLNLGSNELTSIPSQIGQLSSLTDLSLGDNNLVSLPDEMDQLKNLTQLHVYNNKLKTVPNVIYKLKNLTRLHMGYNRIESISEEIGNLTKLTKLSLYDNQLTSMPEAIGNLTKLTKLYLSHNQLTSLPKSIGNLVNLQNGNGLWIHGNPLIKSLPDSIRKIKHALDNPNDIYKFNAMVDHAEYRVEQRVQRRLVIILAKAPQSSIFIPFLSFFGLKQNTNKAIYQVLLEPKLVRLICEYMDWKPFPDEPQQQVQQLQQQEEHEE